jgi:hypothetical protein
MIGFLQATSAIFCEAINIFLLSYQHSISHSIIHFVALEIIMEVDNLYIESLMNNPIIKIFHTNPKV